MVTAIAIVLECVLIDLVNSDRLFSTVSDFNSLYSCAYNKVFLLLSDFIIFCFVYSVSTRKQPAQVTHLGLY